MKLVTIDFAKCLGRDICTACPESFYFHCVESPVMSMMLGDTWEASERIAKLKKSCPVGAITTIDEE